MTEPSQYFKGRTVQEQMNEVIGYVDTRAAEVATDAIAADVAQVHQDMLDADADASAAAASAAAAAGTLSNAVKKTGEASQSIAGNIEVSGTLKSTGTLYAAGDASVGGNLGVGGSTNVGDLTATGVVTVPTPTGNNHAANKKYVDDQDTLNVKITDINTYAVGLTGNQGPIAGSKDFELITSENLVRQKYYSVASGSGNTSYPWRLLYKQNTVAGNNSNSFLTFVYSGSRSGSQSGQTPAIITIFQYGSNVIAMGLGASAPTCVKIIKDADSKAWIFGRCDNNNSGSGSCSFNLLTMRNDTYWDKDTNNITCSISAGVAVDSGGNTIVSGTEVSVTI